jgi:alkylated DNA repair dioxygenase AlkB
MGLGASLFDVADGDGPAPRRLEGPELDAVVFPAAFSPAEADDLWAALRHGIAWRQDDVVLYGRKAAVPRLQAWYGDAGLSYTYSGLRLEPRPWTDELDRVRRRADGLAGVAFNSVLCNLYRNGSDSVAWHADDEPELGEQPVIGSVSFGATRRFALRRRDDPSVRCEVDLGHGDVVVMRGATQDRWLHQVAKTARPTGERINLTFRRIVAAG